MATMFTNPYDAQLDREVARREELRDIAQMDAYDYHAYQAGLASEEVGRNLGGMLGMQTPAEAKQSKIQEIMGKYEGGPKSYEDLISIADEFRSAGMLDLWQEAMDVAKNLTQSEAYSKQVELQNKAIEMKQDEYERKRKHPFLAKDYKNKEAESDTINWFKMNTSIDVSNLGTLTRGQAQDLLIKHYKSKSGAKWSELKSTLAGKETDYILKHETDDISKIGSDETTKADASIFNLPPQVVPSPPPPVTERLVVNQPSIDKIAQIQTKINENTEIVPASLEEEIIQKQTQSNLEAEKSALEVTSRKESKLNRDESFARVIQIAATDTSSLNTEQLDALVKELEELLRRKPKNKPWVLSNPGGRPGSYKFEDYVSSIMTNLIIERDNITSLGGTPLQ